MQISPAEIPDLLIIEPQVFSDHRGLFYESYNHKSFRDKTGLNVEFVQDNHSVSQQHVLRGLHYQIRQPQGKLIRVIAGCIQDIAVDLRKQSSTFGKWISIILSAENRLQLWIPPGFAHGFLVLSEVAEVLYKTSDYYAPQYERCLLWNDPNLAIDWQLTADPILSAKDLVGIPLHDAELFDSSLVTA